MYTSFDHSLDRARRAEIRREVATNRLAANLHSSRGGTRFLVRFMRGLRPGKAEPEGARP